MDKRKNENNVKIKQIKLIMIFGYALIIIIAAVFYGVLYNKQQRRGA
ncbi:MAG: hypothetical protein ACI4J8_00760 [Oscillospiraceae bacterium]